MWNRTKPSFFTKEYSPIGSSVEFSTSACFVHSVLDTNKDFSIQSIRFHRTKYHVQRNPFTS